MALKRYSVWLDSGTLKALEKMAKTEDRPVGWLIRKAVEKFMVATPAKKTGEQ